MQNLFMDGFPLFRFRQVDSPDAQYHLVPQKQLLHGGNQAKCLSPKGALIPIRAAGGHKRQIRLIRPMGIVIFFRFLHVGKDGNP